MKTSGKLALFGLAPILLSGCSIFSGGGTDAPKSVDPASIPSEVVVESGEEYYEATDYSLWFECSGYYRSCPYYYVEEGKPNTRVYDNLYFYEKDYFFVLSKSMKEWYARLSEGHDTTYVEEELTEGLDYHINIKTDGIYTVKWDMDSKRFDVIYKSEIDTPHFYEIKKCRILSNGKYTQMERNPDNQDELCVKGLNVLHAKGITFYETPNAFRVTVDPASTQFLFTFDNKRDDYLSVNVDGPVDIFLNTKTYVARIALPNPDQNTFGFTTLDEEKDQNIAVDPTHPYLFTYDCTIDAAGRMLENISFYDFHVREYEFAVASNPEIFDESEYQGSTFHYFKEAGDYRFQADVLHNTLSVSKR